MTQLYDALIAFLSDVPKGVTVRYRVNPLTREVLSFDMEEDP